MNHLVFVFGTLKEGFPNFGSNTGTRISGHFETVSRYPLYLVGERHSPWMVNAPGSGERVMGQLFNVDANALQKMDVLERVTENDGYQRIAIKVRLCAAEQSKEQEFFAYLKHPKHLGAAAMMCGPLKEYSLEHAALYQSRSTPSSQTPKPATSLNA